MKNKYKISIIVENEDDETDLQFARATVRAEVGNSNEVVDRIIQLILGTE